MGLRGRRDAPPQGAPTENIMQPAGGSQFDAQLAPNLMAHVDYPDIDPLDDLRLSGKSRREKLLAIREMLMQVSNLVLVKLLANFKRQYKFRFCLSDPAFSCML